MDVTQESAWSAAVKATLKRWGGAINNAGIAHAQVIVVNSKADFERVLGVNLIRPFLGIKTVAPVMVEQRRGSIMSISSIGGMTAWNSTAAYCSSKLGMRGVLQVAAMELGHEGVRVNSIHPGASTLTLAKCSTRTPMPSIVPIGSSRSSASAGRTKLPRLHSS